MKRYDSSRAGDMTVFVAVVNRGGFSAAARVCGLTPSGVSKLITRLETRLNTRLLHRSTRRVQLTEEGEAYYARAVRILDDIEAAEREASTGASPRGHVRVNASVPYGRKYLLPLLPRFLAAYPEITVDVMLSDTVIDLMQERADIAIRFGRLSDSALMARKLGAGPVSIVASPDYLARYGVPQSPLELERHHAIGWTFQRLVKGWPFMMEGRVRELTPPIRARASDGDVARDMALGGIGLARLGHFNVAEDIGAGRLVEVLQAFNPNDIEDLHAVFLGGPGPVPARVRALVDFLAHHGRMKAGPITLG